MVRLALVFLGGALGSSARYLVALWMANHYGSRFPWGTFTVNVLGSFLIGLLATLADEAGRIGPGARVFLVVGVLGGFTTFSSFALETLRLAEQRDLSRAVANIAGSILIAFAAAILGIITGRGLAQ